MICFLVDTGQSFPLVKSLREKDQEMNDKKKKNKDKTAQREDQEAMPCMLVVQTLPCAATFPGDPDPSSREDLQGTPPPSTRQQGVLPHETVFLVLHRCYINSNEQRHLSYPICSRQRFLHRPPMLLQQSTSYHWCTTKNAAINLIIISHSQNLSRKHSQPSECCQHCITISVVSPSVLLHEAASNLTASLHQLPPNSSAIVRSFCSDDISHLLTVNLLLSSSLDSGDFFSISRRRLPTIPPTLLFLSAKSVTRTLFHLPLSAIPSTTEDSPMLSTALAPTAHVISIVLRISVATTILLESLPLGSRLFPWSRRF
ncbi:hypothetical protein GW17_00031461 [Ensete ventricosum]|nr:hypothetical protein GW17_00031461 [Ensete ventricosum]